MKRYSIGLIFLFITCMAFGQVSASKSSIFNRAVGLLYKSIPAKWFYIAGDDYDAYSDVKPSPIPVDKEYFIVAAKNGIVLRSLVIYNSSSNKSVLNWYNTGCKTLQDDGWEFRSFAIPDGRIYRKNDIYVYIKTDWDGDYFIGSAFFADSKNMQY